MRHPIAKKLGARAADVAARAFLSSQMTRKLGGMDMNDEEHNDDRDYDDDGQEDEDCDDDEDDRDGGKVKAFITGVGSAAAGAWQSSGPVGKIALVVAAAVVIILLALFFRAVASCCCCRAKEEEPSNEFESLEAPGGAAPRPESPSSPKKGEVPVETTPVQPYQPELVAGQGIPMQQGMSFQGVPYQPSAGYSGPVPLIQVVTMERPSHDMPRSSQ